MDKDLKKNLIFFLGLIVLYLLTWLWGGGVTNALGAALLIITFFTDIDKRLAIIVALLSLATCPFSLLFELEGLAEQAALLTYYGLAIGIIAMVLESKVKKRPWEIIRIHHLGLFSKNIFTLRDQWSRIIKVVIYIFFLTIITISIVVNTTFAYFEHLSIVSHHKMTDEKYRKTEILNDATSITQNFISNKNNLSELVFLFADRIKYNKNGLVFLEIRDQTSHNIVRSAVIRGAMVKNGSDSATSFIFKPISDSKGKEFTFTIWTKGFPKEKPKEENDLRLLFKRTKSMDKCYIYTNEQKRAIKNNKKEIIFKQYSNSYLFYCYLNFFQALQKKIILLKSKMRMAL